MIVGSVKLIPPFRKVEIARVGAAPRSVGLQGVARASACPSKPFWLREEDVLQGWESIGDIAARILFHNGRQPLSKTVDALKPPRAHFRCRPSWRQDEDCRVGLAYQTPELLFPVIQGRDVFAID